MILKIPLLGLFLLVDYVFGSCGVCQANNVACHTETTFSLCNDGIPTDEIVTCPEGRVCTNQATICLPKIDDSVNESCVKGCGICNSYGRVFSCLSARKYAFCFGETTPFYTSTASCSEGYVCDLSSRSVCVIDTDSNPSCNEDFLIPTDGPLESTIGHPSTTDSSTSIEDSTVTDTTARTPRDASTFCSETAITGTYKAEGDTTCKRYFICMSYQAGYKGFEYSCYNSHYFNSVTSLCQRDRPDNC